MFLFNSKIKRVLKDTLLIEGRVKIVDMNKFLNEVITLKKKSLIKFKLTATDESRYLLDKFCEEYEKDSRAGVCNIGEGGTVYIIPPSFQKLVSCLTKDKIGKSSVFAVLVIKSINPSNNEEEANVTIKPVSTTSNGKYCSIINFMSSIFIAPVAIKSQATPSTSTSVKLPSAFDTKTPSAPVPPAIKKPIPTPENAFSNLSSTTAMLNKPLPPVPPNSTTTMATVTPKVIPPPPTMPTSISKPIPPPPAPPAKPIANNVTSSSFATPLVKQEDNILLTAQYCAANGVPAIDALKLKPEARVTTPFLFEDNPLYPEFIRVLKICLGKI